MSRLRKRLALTSVAAVAALLVAAMVPASAAPDQRGTRTYDVTIINLTSGQPLTPPVVATHKAGTELFEVGDPASFPLAQLAENGDVPGLVAALAADPKVKDVAAAGAPLVAFGTPGAGLGFSDRVTLSVSTNGSGKRISFASMLICTNDGFVGIDSLKLPRQVGAQRVAIASGYDAGSEVNTEYFGDIVPPCQDLIGVTGDPGTGASDPGLAEGGVIAHHPGIVGGVDLDPAVHGWTDPVVVFIVERTS